MLGENERAALAHTLVDISKSLQILDRLNLSSEAQTARSLIREGLVKLNSCAMGGNAAGLLSDPHGHASQAPGALAPMLNELVMHLWPRIDTFVSNMVRNDIEPSINASLPGMFKGKVHFDKISMGHSSPCLGPLRVHKIDDHDETIEMHMGIKFESDLDVAITAVGIQIGLTRFSFKGDLVIKMSPKMNKPPFFGGIQVFFPNMPDIGINFVGAARVANIPGLRGSIRSAIDSAIGGICVLPRRIAIDMNDEDDIDITDLAHPDPIWVLRFTLFSGRELIAADTNLFGAATSDPYVQASLGIRSWTSSIINKTLSPVWGESGKGLCFDFPVHNEDQILFLKVFDSDFASADDLIGVGEKLDVSHLRDRHNETFDLKLTLPEEDDRDAGSISVNTRCLSLVEARPPSPSEGKVAGISVAHISMKILSVTGLSHDGHPPYTMRMRVLGTHDHAAHPRLRKSSLSGLPAEGGGWSLFRRAATGNLAGHSVAEDVLAEDSTRLSAPQPEAQLAEALQSICMSLASGKGGTQHTPDEIADIVQVPRRQVENFLSANKSAGGVAKAQKEATESRATTNPVFNEVLHSLLSDVPELGVLEFCVLQKKSQVIATGVIRLRDLMRAEKLHIDGPFRLSLGAEEGSQAEVIGSAWLRWLE